MTSPTSTRSSSIFRRPADPAFGLVAIVLITGFAFLVFFDLGPPLAFNDDWGMAWGARQLIQHHRLAIYPEQSALALVQVVAAWLLGLGQVDQRIFRLTEVPFIALASWCLYRLSRRVGATPRWALVSAALPVTLPLSLAMGTTFMTDLPYLGLFLAASLAAIVWLQDGNGEWWAVVFVFLATLQRQVGAAIPIAITLGLLVASRYGRSLTRRDRAWLLALWTATGMSVAIPVVFHIAPPTQTNRLHELLRVTFGHVFESVAFVPAMVGLLGIPLLAGVLLAPRAVGRSTRPRRSVRLARMVGVLAVAFLPGVVSAHFFGALFPGDVFQDQNIGPITLPAGSKPDALPLMPALVIHAVAVISYTVILGIGLLAWARPRLGGGGALLLGLAASQLLPVLLLQTQPYDRYYLPVVAAAWPLLARAASQARGNVPIAWAIGAMVIGIGVYAVEEQDYQAWQHARDGAARLAMTQYAPSEVSAGYEANAVYFDIPLYETTGLVHGGLAQGAYDPGLALSGPPHPLVYLAISCPQDPRPGVSYQSVAPGRIVLLKASESYSDPCHPR